MNVSDPREPEKFLGAENSGNFDSNQNLSQNAEAGFYSYDLSDPPTHPWELAQSTLSNLLEYSEILERMR